jgi:hypothetical protein
MSAFAGFQAKGARALFTRITSRRSLPLFITRKQLGQLAFRAAPLIFISGSNSPRGLLLKGRLCFVPLRFIPDRKSGVTA